MAVPCVILKDAQLAENIGAAARVMANFGLGELRLVSPRDGWPQARAWPSASGADWVLDEARVFDTLDAAIADLTLVLATTARPREGAVRVIGPRAGAAELHASVGPCGLLFGGERAGLESDDIALCHGVISAPVAQRHRSLNLAQAVAIVSYEWRMASEGGGPGEDSPEPAPQAAMQGLFAQLEAELDAAGFFHPAEKRPSMIRNLRTALGRARFTDQEVRTFRGVVTALSRGRGKVLEKLAAKKAREEPLA